MSHHISAILSKVYIAIENTNGSQTYATTTSAVVDVTTGDASFTGQILTDGGYFFFVWNLVGGTTGSALTCAQANAGGGVDALSTVTGGSTAFDDVFTCTDGRGLTAGLPMGSYTVAISALDSTTGVVGRAPTLPNEVISSPNKVTDLGTVTISIANM